MLGPIVHGPMHYAGTTGPGIKKMVTKEPSVYCDMGQL